MSSYYSAPMLNKVLIVGNVVSEPRVSLTTANKMKVANFRIACSRKFRTKTAGLREEYCYVSIVAWMRVAVVCEKNLKKGDKVFVEGSLQSREFSDTKMSVVEILADRIQILTPKKIIVDSEEQNEEQNDERNKSDIESQE